MYYFVTLRFCGSFELLLFLSPWSDKGDAKCLSNCIRSCKEYFCLFYIHYWMILIWCLLYSVSNLQRKCEKYWPDKTAYHGDVVVTLRKEETHADYIVRDFLINLKLQVITNLFVSKPKLMDPSSIPTRNPAGFS